MQELAQRKVGATFGVIYINPVSYRMRGVKMEPILEGAAVKIRTADGKILPRRALTGIEKGQDFLVVWVCKQEEWNLARKEGRTPYAIPWPADAVEAVPN